MIRVLYCQIIMLTCPMSDNHVEFSDEYVDLSDIYDNRMMSHMGYIYAHLIKLQNFGLTFLFVLCN